MEPSRRPTLHFRRSHFATQLPMDYRYTPSHAWLAEIDPGFWRVGLTKFATRMLGEMVETEFQLAPGSAVKTGQIIGWIEGFKAISDLYCVVDGVFAGSNPALKERITLINTDPYEAGWLYEARGLPDPKCVDVHGYREILDKTIEHMLQKQTHPSPP